MIKVKITDEQEVRDLCHIATQICGLHKDSLASQDRRKQFQIPRQVVSNIARIEKGIHYNVIAKVLNRDRCSVYHYESKHQDNYVGWKDYRKLFNRIFNAYSDIKKSKKTFSSEHILNDHLNKNGVKESNRPTVFIQVYSGCVETIVKTDYVNFSNQLENIRLCLHDYEYSLNVKL